MHTRARCRSLVHRAAPARHLGCARPPARVSAAPHPCAARPRSHLPHRRDERCHVGRHRQRRQRELVPQRPGHRPRAAVGVRWPAHRPAGRPAAHLLWPRCHHAEHGRGDHQRLVRTRDASAARCAAALWPLLSPPPLPCRSSLATVNPAAASSCRWHVVRGHGMHAGFQPRHFLPASPPPAPRRYGVTSDSANPATVRQAGRARGQAVGRVPLLGAACDRACTPPTRMRRPPLPPPQVYAINNPCSIIKSGGDGSGSYTDMGAGPSWFGCSYYLEIRNGRAAQAQPGLEHARSNAGRRP